MIDYDLLLKVELEGIMEGQLEKINRINNWYKLYEGNQGWETDGGLDYVPTKKITNYIKKLINNKARFMFGKEPYYNLSSDNDTEQEKKSILLNKILEENKFHSKVLKGYKDCLIGGKVAIKLWGNSEEGLKIIFAPAQEFIEIYDTDDIDKIQKIIFIYWLNTDVEEKSLQRIRKQTWEMKEGKCILNEGIYDGNGLAVSIEYEDNDTGLDFIPILIVQNGGLTGDTTGYSLVEDIWHNQDAYNKLTSDDIDALKFQMFGQDVITDADEKSIKSLKIAPKALIDLQTDMGQAADGRQAKMDRLESGFGYKDKFADTINRIKNDMYDLSEVPNVSLDQLQGLVQSGKSMKALYWGIIAACEEEWTEWGPILTRMAEYIFKMVEVYNLYKEATTAKYETTMELQHSYPIQEDEIEAKKSDMQEVVTEVRSRATYIKKWGEVEDINEEIEKIRDEKRMLEDSYTRELVE